MAGSTEFYGIAFFDFGDTLDSPLNIQKEVQRFVLIDRQLYAMFSVFGNGVITGWNVTDTGGLSVNISAGVGIINSFAIETDFASTLTDLPPNTACYIYAQIDATTITDRTPTFVYSLTTLSDGNSLLLAIVTTGSTANVAIDTTVINQIGFQTIIAEQIKLHRHNGIIAPKIDLTSEVQGPLSMDRIADIDASKITSGILPYSVMPQIDHRNLLNIGTLTHPQLDSFANSIQRDNIALFGEVTTINLLKMITGIKYYNTDVDKYFENQLYFIPGITRDDWFDYVNTTAHVDKFSHCISGIPALPQDLGGVSGSSSSAGGQNLAILTVPWTSDADFDLASSITNLAVNNGVFIDVDTTNAQPIETFDTGISGQSVSYYTPTLNETSTTKVTYAQPAAQGPLSGLFTMSNSRSAVFKKTFATPQDWSNFDTLNIYVKSSASSHAAVTLVVYDTSGKELGSFLLLGADEITTYTNQATNGFALKDFGITGFTRTAVGGIGFTTNQITSTSESFSVDTIYLTSQNFLLPQGDIVFRYNTTSAVIFNSVEYDANIPTGCDLRVRVRTGNTLNELANATYSSLLSSGQVFATVGTYIEIDITFLSDATLTKTPTLTALYLSLLVPSVESGITINSLSDWEQGIASNVTISSDAVLSMTRENIGDIYFINGQTVNELNPNLTPVAGVSYNNMPIAPYQGYAAINPSAQVPDPTNPGREFLTGLFHPRSVVRLASGNFLIADSGNDRVLEMTQDSQFVRGYASHNNIYDTSLYALTANYNPRLGVLFITFSMLLDVKYADLTQIVINVGSRQIQLSNSVDQVRDPTTGAAISRPDLTAFLDGSNGNFTGQTDNVLSIILSSDKQAFLENATSDIVTVQVVGNPNPTSTVTVALNQITGIQCFIGDYMYFGMNGIWSPICAKETTSDRYIIANAMVNYNSPNLAPTGIIGIIEFEKAVGSSENGSTVGTTFTYSLVKFSDILLGSVTYFETLTSNGVKQRKLLVAAMQDSTNPASGSSSSSTASTSTSTTQPTFLGNTNPQKFAGFQGVVQVIDMDSQLSSFNYSSPDGMFPSDAFFNDAGNIVVAESSLYPQSGRIITLNSTGTIIDLIGDGMYSVINAVRNLPSGHIFVST